MSDSGHVVRVVAALAFVLSLGLPALPQDAVDSGKVTELGVYTEHPRLFLRPQRLRLLKRETQRQALRWEQFQTLVGAKATMPEPAFALALYYEAGGDRE